MVDDNFIGNKKCVKELMPHLVKWMRDHGFPFSLFTEASLNLAEDPELLQQMREAHFTRVFLGIETPVEESLKETTKFQNLRRSLLESVRSIQSRGIEVMAGFIVGFDSDPKDVFERQLPARLQARPDVVGKIDTVYQFDISGPGGGTWTVDCTVPGGKVTAGASAPARCVVSAPDQDMLGILSGRLNPQMAYLSGKLEIDGDIGLALKLEPRIKEKIDRIVLMGGAFTRLLDSGSRSCFSRSTQFLRTSV